MVLAKRIDSFHRAQLAMIEQQRQVAEKVEGVHVISNVLLSNQHTMTSNQQEIFTQAAETRRMQSQLAAGSATSTTPRLYDSSPLTPRTVAIKTLTPSAPLEDDDGVRIARVL